MRMRDIERLPEGTKVRVRRIDGTTAHATYRGIRLNVWNERRPCVEVDGELYEVSAMTIKEEVL